MSTKYLPPQFTNSLAPSTPIRWFSVFPVVVWEWTWNCEWARWRCLTIGWLFWKVEIDL